MTDLTSSTSVPLPVPGSKTRFAVVAQRPRPLIWAGLALIVLLNVAASLYWVSVNVVLVGRDSAGHLEQSILVGRELLPFRLESLFSALTLDDYRPPGLYLATQPFYWLLGTSMDAAQLPNILLLAAIVVLTFFLARRLMGDGYALFAALLVGLLPMMAAMARLYYMEHLLTTALLVTLLALLAADGFARRGWALAFGLFLGVALLVKWTAPVYVVAPTIFVLWRTGFWGEQVQAVRGARLHWRRAAIALLVGAGLALLWYLPGRATALDRAMPLGDWLPLLWTLVFAALIYVWGGSPGRVRNFWTAALLAMAIASLWYLPRIDFLVRLGDVAFGTDRGTQESFSLLRASTYTRYFGYWLSHHMGPLATLLILPVAAVGWILRWPAWRKAPDTIAAYWLTVGGAWLLLMLLAQSNPRNLVPLLPIVAVLLAESLRALARPLAILAGVVWVAVLGAQWATYTFDGLAWLYERAPALWVHGDYTAWPAHGPSAPGYWIHPDILATIASPGGRPEGEAASLGMLIDTWELHRGALRYLVTAKRLNIDVNPLTESSSKGWSDLMANEWVLLKDGDNGEVKAPGQAMLARIAAHDPLFDQLYGEVRAWTLPNGDTVRLYRRAVGPRQPREYPVVLIETSTIADVINQWWSPGSTLVFSTPDTAAWLGLHDLRADKVVVGGDATQPADYLDGLTGTLLVATRYDTPAVQEYLRATSYYAGDAGDGEFRLAVVGRPQDPLESVPPQTSWDKVEVTELRTLPEIRPGGVLPLELTSSGQNDGALKMSVRLLGPDGQPVAQRDVAVEPEVRLGLLVPPAAAPGDFQLGAVLYDPQTLAPLPDVRGDQFGALATIRVQE